MSCPFKNIYNLAKVVINSYKIEALKNYDEDAFYEYMRSLLTLGISEFKGSLVSLDYYSNLEIDSSGNSKTIYYFTNDLSLDEQNILAKTIVLKWWEGEIQTTTAYQPKLSFREFKQSATEQNLKQKSEYKDKLCEDISRSITEYQLSNIDKLPFFGGG